MPNRTSKEGAKLKLMRDGAGLSQEQLADQLNVSRMTVIRWEQAEVLPKGRLSEVAELLGVDLTALLDAPPTPEPTTQLTHVHSQDSLVLWQRAVGRAKHADPMIKLLLLTLPILIDEDAWIVLTTVEQLIDVTHMHEAAEKIREVWPQVVESPWVERVGQVEWVFRLRFAGAESES